MPADLLRRVRCPLGYHCGWRVLAVQEVARGRPEPAVVSYAAGRYRRAVGKQLQEGGGDGEEDESGGEGQHHDGNGVADGARGRELGACGACWLSGAGLSGWAAGIEVRG